MVRMAHGWCARRLPEPPRLVDVPRLPLIRLRERLHYQAFVLFRLIRPKPVNVLATGKGIVASAEKGSLETLPAPHLPRTVAVDGSRACRLVSEQAASWLLPGCRVLCPDGKHGENMSRG